MATEGNRTRTAVFRIFRGDNKGGALHDYTTGVSEGMVVLDAVHDIQAHQANDLACRWNCKAGKCGSCSAEVNGMPKLMCNDAPERSAAGSSHHDRTMKAFPAREGFDHTDVSWNFAVKKRIKEFKPRPPDAADGTCEWPRGYRSGAGISKCIECFLCQDVCHVLRDHNKHDQFIGRAFLSTRRRWKCIHSTPRIASRSCARRRASVSATSRSAVRKSVGRHPHTDNAIIPLKERVVDDYYDPLDVLEKKFAAGMSVRRSRLSPNEKCPSSSHFPKRRSRGPGKSGALSVAE